MGNRNWWLGLLAASSLLLAGCGVLSGTAVPTSGTSVSPETSAPGSSTGHPHAAPSPSAQVPGDGSGGNPSEAALMVCGPETQTNVASILALKSSPHTVTTWADHLYTCTYHLPDGSFVLSVKESADQGSARAYFDGLRGTLANTAPIEGLANLGFPAYQDQDGSVVFLKDNMTLNVDASDLPGTVGPHSVTRTALAYQVATTILACWTE